MENLQRRDLNLKLIEYFDIHVPQVLSPESPSQWVVYAAKSLVGIYEKAYNSGELVELLQDTIGIPEKESWCMSALQSCVAYAEYKTGIKSYLYPTEHCLTALKNHPKDKILDKPEFGCAVIWQHGSTSNGHTGVFEKMFNDKIMVTYEGNTSASNTTVESNGDVFDRKLRSMSTIGDMKIVGFLRLFHV